MGRKKNAAHEEPRPAEAAGAADFEKDEPLQRPQEAAEKLRTIDMVRAAIAAGKGMPKEGIAWIKSTYGVAIKLGNFSVTKSTIQRGRGKSGDTSKQIRTPRASKAPAASPVIASTPPAPPSNGHLKPSDAARQVKALVDQLGAEEVRNLVDLFDR